jgi:hypothetical protein
MQSIITNPPSGKELEKQNSCSNLQSSGDAIIKIDDPEVEDEAGRLHGMAFQSIRESANYQRIHSVTGASGAGN